MKIISEESFIGIPWIICGLISLVISAVYFFVWPKELEANRLEHFVLRYFHSFVWIFLGFACFVMEFKILGGIKTANLASKFALIFYFIFMAVFVMKKF